MIDVLVSVSTGYPVGHFILDVMLNSQAFNMMIVMNVKMDYALGLENTKNFDHRRDISLNVYEKPTDP